MDTLGVLNHLSNVMTVDEWQQFRSSDDYLWMMAKVEGYKGAAMKKLVEAGKRKRAEAWEIALEMAERIVTDELAELSLHVTEQQRKDTIQALAEKLMMEQNLTPPTFTVWTDCATCGRVPVPPDVEPITPNCPWCQL